MNAASQSPTHVKSSIKKISRGYEPLPLLQVFITHFTFSPSQFLYFSTSFKQHPSRLLTLETADPHSMLTPGSPPCARRTAGSPPALVERFTTPHNRPLPHPTDTYPLPDSRNKLPGRPAAPHPPSSAGRRRPQPGGPVPAQGSPQARRSPTHANSDTALGYAHIRSAPAPPRGPAAPEALSALGADITTGGLRFRAPEGLPAGWPPPRGSMQSGGAEALLQALASPHHGKRRARRRSCRHSPAWVVSRRESRETGGREEPLPARCGSHSPRAQLGAAPCRPVPARPELLLAAAAALTCPRDPPAPLCSLRRLGPALKMAALPGETMPGPGGGAEAAPRPPRQALRARPDSAAADTAPLQPPRRAHPRPPLLLPARRRASPVC